MQGKFPSVGAAFLRLLRNKWLISVKLSVCVCSCVCVCVCVCQIFLKSEHLDHD